MHAEIFLNILFLSTTINICNRSHRKCNKINTPFQNINDGLVVSSIMPSAFVCRTLCRLASLSTGSEQFAYWMDTSTSSCMTSSVVGVLVDCWKSESRRFLSRDLIGSGGISGAVVHGS